MTCSRTAGKRSGRRGLRAAWVGTMGPMVAAALLALAAGGCSIQKPTLALRDIEVAGLDFEKIDLVLDLTVTNPNEYAISLYGLDYEISAGGRRFGGGSLPRPVTPLEASQTSVIKAPLSVTFRDLKPLAAEATSGKDIEYELTGEATFTLIGLKIKVPLKRTGKLPALKAPSWRFADVRLSRAALTAEVVFEVDNPNPFALPLRALTGVVKYGDQPVLRVDQPSLSPVPAGKTTAVAVPVKLESAGVA
ncbi:MAG: LEA/WHy family protein, partial [Planctomycetota bacterium]